MIQQLLTPNLLISPFDHPSSFVPTCGLLRKTQIRTWTINTETGGVRNRSRWASRRGVLGRLAGEGLPQRPSGRDRSFGVLSDGGGARCSGGSVGVLGEREGYGNCLGGDFSGGES